MLKRILFLQIRGLYTLPRYSFCQQKPPQGFEKFQRKQKSNINPDQKIQQSQQNEQKNIKQEENSQNQEQEIKQNEQQEEEYISNTKHKPYKVPKFSEKQKITKDKKYYQDLGEQIKKEYEQKINQQWDQQQEQKEEQQQNTQKEEQEDELRKQRQKEYEEKYKESQQKYNQKKKQQQQQYQFNQKGQFNQQAYQLFQNYPQLKYILLGIPILYIIYKSQTQEAELIQYQEFYSNYLKKNLIGQIEIHKEEGKIIGTIYTREGKKKIYINNLDYFLQQLDEFQFDKQIQEMIPVHFINQDEAYEMSAVLSRIVQFGLYAFAFFFLFQLFRQFQRDLSKFTNSDMMGGQKHFKSKQFESKVNIKFKDVAGLEEAKGEIKEFVDFLKAPNKYKKLGARIPRGALLTGPPGTGKTLIAKACAGEAGVPFFSVSGSDFVEMFVGLGAARVRELFKQAKHKAPSIVFIDEIDAIGKKRNQKGSRNEERDNTLNQLLVEMDGFGTDDNVVILAATNIKETLDNALTRPGRFDRSIDITLPDIEGRKQIFKVHLAPLKLDPSKTMDDYANRLATLTPGFSGAEIANLCNEAAILAARQNAKFITSHHFELASERVQAGLEKRKTISEEERKIIAYHECGHAIVSWFLEGGDPLLKLTIIPRSKGSLGYAQYLPNESSLQTKEELFDKICCALGGRISEQIFFNSITTGAHDDLKKVYDIANAIVTKLGMVDSIGYLGYEDDQYSKDYSDETNTIIDKEIKAIIQECTEKTRSLITEHRESIEKLAAKLLEKETLDLEAIIDVLGERPFQAKSNYKAYLNLRRVEKQELINEQEEQEIQSKQIEESQEEQQQEQSEQQKDSKQQQDKE